MGAPVTDTATAVLHAVTASLKNLAEAGGYAMLIPDAAYAQWAPSIIKAVRDAESQFAEVPKVIEQADEKLDHPVADAG